MREKAKIIGTFVAVALASTTIALSAELIGDQPRKWSQPSYDEVPDSALNAAPELESFTGKTDNDAALFDGDGRPLKPRSAPSR